MNDVNKSYLQHGADSPRPCAAVDRVALVDCARGFLDAFGGALDEHRLSRFAGALAGVDTGAVQRGPMPPFQHESMRHLQALLPSVADERIRRAARALDWGQLYDGGGIDSVLAEGMLAAQAAGTYGVFAAQQVACGFFLLAPGVHYPLHTHAAGEVYYCLAGQIDITHRLDEAPLTLRAGQSSETPSGRLHALQTGSQPVLLAYIWMGDISAPTWWWSDDGQHGWTRTAWRRNPGESWKVERSEPVSQAVFQAAMT